MTAVYGILPDGRSPAQIADLRRQYDRDRFRANRAGTQAPQEPLTLLPWSLEELIGSLWVNIWTGFRESVLRIDTDRWGDPALIIRDAGDGFSSWQLGERLGTWRRERDGYCIDFWVRIDLLSPAEQLPWWMVRCEDERAGIARLRRQIAELKARRDHSKYSKYSTDTENINMWSRDVKHHTEALKRAVADVKRFAAEHQLELPPDFGCEKHLAEKTVHVGETTLVQSALF